MTSNNTSKKPNLLIIVSFCFGTIIGCYGLILYKKWSDASISNSINIEINPFEVITMLITIALTIYVARVLGKVNEQEKTEKDMLINYLLEFKKDLRLKCDDIHEKEDIEITKLNSHCKILRKRIYSILCISRKYNFMDKDDETAEKIQEKVTDIWETLTNTPRKPHEKSNPQVKDGLTTIRKEKLNQVESSIIEVEELIFDLVVKINSK